MLESNILIKYYVIITKTLWIFIDLKKKIKKNEKNKSIFIQIGYFLGLNL